MAKSKATPKKPTPEVDRADPRFRCLDLAMYQGVVDGRTKDDLAAWAYQEAKRVKLKNFGKAEANRMVDFYKGALTEAELKGKFHVAVLKQNVKEEAVKLELVNLASEFEPPTPADLRDHTDLYNAVATAQGNKPWRDKCRELLERLELCLGDDFTPQLAELRDRMTDVFGDVVEAPTPDEECEAD